MRKIFVMLCAIFILTGCGVKKLSGYDEITYQEYKSLVENAETFPLVIGSSTCSACSLFKGTMETFIKNYQVDVRFIDVSKLSEEEYNEFLSDINFTSTPTTVFFKDGKQTSVYHRIVGAEGYGNVIKGYERMGYINV